MAKHRYPAPEWEQALDCLRGMVQQPLSLVLALYPTSTTGRVAVAAELRLVTGPNTTALVRRWGEEVSSRSETAVAAAAYRAALSAHLFCEGKSPVDLVKWARWEVGAEAFKA